MEVVRPQRKGCPCDRNIDFGGLHQTEEMAVYGISRTDSHMSVVSTLATSYDFRHCKDSHEKGEMPRLVFTVLLDCGVPTHKAMAGNFVLCFCSYLTSHIAVVYRYYSPCTLSFQKTSRYTLLFSGLKNLLRPLTHTSIAFFAILKAPSLVLLPPMKPLA